MDKVYICSFQSSFHLAQFLTCCSYGSKHSFDVDTWMHVIELASKSLSHVFPLGDGYFIFCEPFENLSYSIVLKK